MESELKYVDVDAVYEEILRWHAENDDKRDYTRIHRGDHEEKKKKHKHHHQHKERHKHRVSCSSLDLTALKEELTQTTTTPPPIETITRDNKEERPASLRRSSSTRPKRSDNIAEKSALFDGK
jgi:hypothetical protein